MQKINKEKREIKAKDGSDRESEASGRKKSEGT